MDDFHQRRFARNKFKYTLLLFFISFSGVPAISQNLTVDHIQELDFGEKIFPGTEMSIDPADANAASFILTGEVGKEVYVKFHLPDNLLDASDNSLKIYFPSDGAFYHTDATNKSSATLFNPSSGVVTSLNKEGKLYLWLGAVIQPSSTQGGTTYSGDITIDASYTN